MKVRLISNENPLEYRGINEKGNEIKLSGNGTAVGPMESVLLAAAGCSSIDIELILTKMRQKLTRLEVDVDAKRAEDQVPKVFTEIHLHYTLYGEIKLNKAQSAVEKSVEKYCSVLTMLEATVKVTYTFEIKNED